MHQSTNNVSTLVIGAGMAGLTAAHHLHGAGHDVVVLEKSRAIGGRMATREVAEHGLQFDHGAQYVRARSPGFIALIEELTKQGSVSSWPARGGSDFDPDGVVVGAPLMRAFTAPMADGVDIRFNTLVTGIERASGGWMVTTDKGVVTARKIVSAIPSPQALMLFSSVEPTLAEALSRVEIAPCWALMVAFDQPLDVVPDCQRHVSETIGWMARDGSKPWRTGGETWVVHALPDWSRDHLELSREDVAPLLMAEFAKALRENFGVEGLPQPTWLRAHRWRYAQTITPFGQSHWSNTDGTLHVGGDWCLGARVEFAHTSGLAMAKAGLK